MRRFLPLLVLLVATSAFAQPVTMKVGQRQQLAPTGRSAGAPANWISSDPRVAVVINSASPKLNGMVVAHKPGTVTITATAGTDKTEIKVLVAKP